MPTAIICETISGQVVDQITFTGNSVQKDFSLLPGGRSYRFKLLDDCGQVLCFEDVYVQQKPEAKWDVCCEPVAKWESCCEIVCEIDRCCEPEYKPESCCEPLAKFESCCELSCDLERCCTPIFKPESCCICCDFGTYSLPTLTVDGTNSFYDPSINLAQAQNGGAWYLIGTTPRRVYFTLPHFADIGYVAAGFSCTNSHVKEDFAAGVFWNMNGTELWDGSTATVLGYNPFNFMMEYGCGQIVIYDATDRNNPILLAKYNAPNCPIYFDSEFEEVNNQFGRIMNVEEANCI